MVLFVSGCLLRCTYCHNPDTWHLKDGTHVSAQQVIDRLGGFAPALRALDGGLTISGGEPMVQLAFTRRILAGAKQMGLHTAIETSGFLGDRADEQVPRRVDLVLLDIKSCDPETYRKVTGRELAPTLRFAERLAAIGKPVWVRFTLVPGLTDDPANVDKHRAVRRADEERRVGRGAAVPPARRLQVEGDGARVQARGYAAAHARTDQSRASSSSAPRAAAPADRRCISTVSI